MLHSPPVVIRVEIDQLKHAIHTALSPEIVARDMQAQIDEALKNFDFTGAVNQAVHEVLGDTVKEFFKYGEGKKAIAEVLTAAMATALAKPPEG